MNPIYLLLSIFLLLYILPLCICLYLSFKDMYKSYKHNKENPDRLPIVYTYGDIITICTISVFPVFNIFFTGILLEEEIEELFSFWNKRAL